MTDLAKRRQDAIDRVCSKDEWMAGKVVELMDLFDEMRSVKEVELVESLLLRLEIVDDAERYRLKMALADDIIARFGALDNTLFVAMTTDSHADGGQGFLNEMKTAFIERDIAIASLNNFSKSWARSYRKFSRFIVVDDFVGSGKTIRKRISDFQKNYPAGDKELVFAVLAGMDYALTGIHHATGIEIICPKRLKRGIRDFYRGYEMLDNDRMMTEIEAANFGEWNTSDFRSRFSLGYGRAQSLLWYKFGHVANNVFPIFWWPFGMSKKDRKHLFCRYEKDIQEIKRG